MTDRIVVLESFIRGYHGAALWTEQDELGDPLNHHFDEADISAESQQRANEVCAEFVQANFDDLVQFVDKLKRSEDKWSSAGHDFWLTRNGHGAGFWDRGAGESGDKLTKAAKVYGNVNLVIGDDGKLHYE